MLAVGAPGARQAPEVSLIDRKVNVQISSNGL